MWLELNNGLLLTRRHTEGAPEHRGEVNFFCVSRALLNVPNHTFIGREGAEIKKYMDTRLGKWQGCLVRGPKEKIGRLGPK